MLRVMRILTRVDRDALAAYCQCYARWKEAELFLDKHGAVFPIRDEKGGVRCMLPFPQVAISRSSLQMLQRYQQEFGMTPSARTRVHEIPNYLQDADDERFFGPQPSSPPPRLR